VFYYVGEVVNKLSKVYVAFIIHVHQTKAKLEPFILISIAKNVHDSDEFFSKNMSIVIFVKYLIDPIS